MAIGLIYHTPLSRLQAQLRQTAPKYVLSYFRLVVSEILITFAEKFIMSDYGADGYNETAQGNAFPHPTGSC